MEVATRRQRLEELARSRLKKKTKRIEEDEASFYDEKGNILPCYSDTFIVDDGFDFQDALEFDSSQESENMEESDDEVKQPPPRINRNRRTDARVSLIDPSNSPPHLEKRKRSPSRKEVIIIKDTRKPSPQPITEKRPMTPPVTERRPITPTIITTMDLSDASLVPVQLDERLTTVSSPQTLTSLDLSGNPLMNSSIHSLRSLLTKTPNLTSLNLSNMWMSDAALKIISNGMVNCLYLSQLSLANNPNLLSSKSHLSSADPLLDVLKLVARLPITHLDLGHTGMKIDNPTNFQILLGSTPQSPRITSLHLDSNDIGSSALNVLGRSLGDAPYLTSLDISHCGMTSQSFQHLLGGLHFNTSLQNLILRGSDLGNVGLKSLASLTRLITLDLSGCNISFDDFKQFCHSASEQNQLQKLILMANRIQITDDEPIIGIFQKLVHLSLLDLSENDVHAGRYKIFKEWSLGPRSHRRTTFDFEDAIVYMIEEEM
eukprot:TRINITY_DN5545_c0_g1_i1.p1 TRINITY_DN5545_c0_g1~~TRINITY_DN5545_c0_g1_i1.p1  ORF type:complete len:488 (+),score=87.07 TRINITY_DN5545_c0_g1_i1:180-1643(+)